MNTRHSNSPTSPNLLRSENHKCSTKLSRLQHPSSEIQVGSKKSTDKIVNNSFFESKMNSQSNNLLHFFMNSEHENVPKDGGHALNGLIKSSDPAFTRYRSTRFSRTEDDDDDEDDSEDSEEEDEDEDDDITLSSNLQFSHLKKSIGRNETVKNEPMVHEPAPSIVHSSTKVVGFNRMACARSRMRFPTFVSVYWFGLVS